MKILCISDGDTARGPMLAALLRKELEAKGIEAEVESAGLWMRANNDNHPKESAVRCMAQRGINLKEHRSRWVHRLDLSEYDRIFCMEQGQIDKLNSFYPPGRISGIARANAHDVPNPRGQPLKRYQEIAQLLERAASHLVARLL